MIVPPLVVLLALGLGGGLVGGLLRGRVLGLLGLGELGLGFALVLAAALVHYVFFSALICMQVEMSVPPAAYAALLGAGFWLAAICETCFRGKKQLLFLTGLMLGWGIMRRIMADAYESTGFSCRGLILTNLLLFLLLAFLWHVCRNVPQKRKAVR